MCCPLLTLLMESVSSLDPGTLPFESGILRPAPRLVSPWTGTLTMCHPLLTLLIEIISSLDPLTAQFVYGTYLHTFTSHIHPLVIQHATVFLNSQTRKVGSLTQRMAYSIGYPQTAMQVCIHLLS